MDGSLWSLRSSLDINTALELYGPSTVAVSTDEALTVVVLGCSNTVPVP